MNPTKEEMISYIAVELDCWLIRHKDGTYETLDIYPHHLLIRAKKIGGNMVINNYGTILFNMAGTPLAEGSYREIKGYDITQPLQNQEESIIKEIYLLVKEVKEGLEK